MALQGFSFCCNGNIASRELTSMPCSSIKSFGTLQHLSSPSPKESNFVFSKTFGRGHKIQLFPGQHHLYRRTGRSICLNEASHLLLLRPCQAKSDDSDGSLTGESIILDEQTLERDLHIAISEENYAKAAKIRDSLKLLHEDSRTSVLAANARFYNSFKAGDLATMQTLWAKGNNICCVHPGARGISGYDDVMTSWEYVWANYEFPLEIELKDVNVHVRGDVGYVTCVELVKTKGSSWGGQFVTNLFEKIDGQWFICIHHASPIDL
ncbi:hypothetical protein FEM48_Zijuj11G0101600 [Ziziphus jujuba var. spinosa]|uniref:F-box protein SKIP8 n=1 Tax=Ziziphus jujuba var. spinosa TaxID=714518 RepID=A0A978UIC2_ZIZJJ|nr:hypothetical protein FEM48_Zijuj11G0101600 [Ziziphus jujuba var. spinosa]